MDRNKAVIFAFNSLQTLRKAWRSNHYSFLPSKPLVLLNSLCTSAAAGRLDFLPGRGFVIATFSMLVDGQWRDHDEVVKPSDRIMMNSLRQSYWIDDYKAACSYGEDVGRMFLEAERQEQATLEDLDTYCMEGNVVHAMQILRLLLEMGISVDLPRYLNLMNLCKGERYLSVAKWIHGHLVRSFGPITDGTFCNKILQMYARCGSMSDAFSTLCTMPESDLASWDIMIRGYVRNGLGEEAIVMFTRFKEAPGRRPDGQMYLGVFDACAEVGDAIEGMLHFESMSKVYGIVPTMNHYVGIVKMLGALGHLDEALEFIERMPVEPTIHVWTSLIYLCRVHGNSELGDHCVEIVEKLDSFHLTKEMKAGLVAPSLIDKHYNF